MTPSDVWKLVTFTFLEGRRLAHAGTTPWKTACGTRVPIGATLSKHQGDREICPRCLEALPTRRTLTQQSPAPQKSKDRIQKYAVQAPGRALGAYAGYEFLSS